MTLRSVMENFIKHSMPEVMTTKAGPQCEDRLERDMPSNVFCHGHYKVRWNRSVVSDSLRPHGLLPTRLLRPWDSPGKNTGVGCHFLLQGIFPTQGSNPDLPHWRQTLNLWATREAKRKIANDQITFNIPTQKVPAGFSISLTSNSVRQKS